MNDSVATDRFATVLLSSFAGAALLLALLGVYGVLAYSVTVRQQEFGIRIALGSDQAKLIRLVLRQASYPVLGGLLLGRVLRSWLPAGCTAWFMKQEQWTLLPPPQLSLSCFRRPSPLPFYLRGGQPESIRCRCCATSNFTAGSARRIVGYAMHYPGWQRVG